jgi:hypothetical protein
LNEIVAFIKELAPNNINAYIVNVFVDDNEV